MSIDAPATRSRTYAVTATRAVFVLLLVGHFDFGRFGIGALIGLPVIVWATLLTSLVLLPWWHSLTREARLVGAGLGPGFYYMLWALGMIISAGWAPTGALVADRSIDFGVSVACVGLILTAFAASREAAFKSLITAIALTGTIYALAGLLTLGSVSRVSAFGGGPNVYGRVTGLAVLGVCHLLLSRGWPAVTAVLLPILVFATAASGSRGAMLALIVALLALTPAVVRQRARFVAAQLWLLPAAALVWLVVGRAVTSIIVLRFGVLTLKDHYSSGRESLYPIAIEMFRSSPLRGNGLGSFGAAVNDPTSYPHNLVLQVGAEAGLFGLLPFFLALAVGLLPLFRRWGQDLACTSMLSMSLLMLTASMVSGDYFDSRFLWLFLAAGGALRSHAVLHSVSLPRARRHRSPGETI